MVQSVKFATFDKNLCRLCGNTTNTTQRFAIFSDNGKTVKLQRLIRDFAKVRVQELSQNTVKPAGQAFFFFFFLDKLLAFQTRRAKTHINLGKGGENQALLPYPVVCKGRKSRIQTDNSSRKALFHDEKEKSRFSSTASDKIGPVKEPNSTFFLDQSYLNFQIAEISAQRSIVETTPNLLQTQVLTW